jgi:hypothetical protein
MLNHSKTKISYIFLSISVSNFFSIFSLLELNKILYSSKISSEFVTSFASEFLIKLLQPAEFALFMSHGIANKSFPCSRANLAVIKLPDLTRASMMITQTDKARTISFLIGKL